jgi:hypothetical protein
MFVEPWRRANPVRRSIMRSALGVLLAAAVVSTAAFAGDTYDKEQTEIVLNRAARQVLANCGFAKDEDGKELGPWGKTSVSVTLGHNGHTKSVTIPEPFDQKPTGKCAVKAFSNLTFPPWSGPDETIEWPVEIKQPHK